MLSDNSPAMLSATVAYKPPCPIAWHETPDPFISGGLRYVGFVNELTAATSRAIPFRWWNPAGQAIGVFYTLGHMVYSIRRARRESREHGESLRQTNLESLQKGGASLIFQLGGNVVLPWVFIMSMHKLVETGLKRLERLGHVSQGSVWFQILPTVMGLLSIPLITRYIDPLLERFFENHYLPTTDRWIARDIAKKAPRQSKPSDLGLSGYRLPSRSSGPALLTNEVPYTLR